jgi:hypothetical protein
MNVYWTCIEKEWMLARTPEQVYKYFSNKNLYSKENAWAGLQYCPSFKSELNNLFQVRSIYDYEFFVNQEKVYSKDKDQNFFNEHVFIRDKSLRLYSFLQRYIFFTDSNSLEVQFYQFPFLENNNITKRCRIIPGRLDIAKWFRPNEFAFYLNEEYNSFKVERNEIMYYIKFITNQKINFVQFNMTEKLEYYKNSCLSLRDNNMIYPKKLTNYYENFKFKKIILKEIKQNSE